MNKELQELIPGLPDDVAAQCLLKLDYAKINVFASVSRRWKQELLSPDFLIRRRIAGLTQSFLAFLLEEEPFRDVPRHISYIALLNPKSKQWLRLPHIPSDEGSPDQSYALVRAGDRMVAMSTWSSSYTVPTVYIFNLLDGGWRPGTPSPIQNSSMPACASDGVRRVFLAGGQHPPNAVSYDVDNDTWQILPKMAKPSEICNGYFHDGIFLVTGSHQIDYLRRSRRAAKYNASAGEWSFVTEFAPCVYPVYENEELGLHFIKGSWHHLAFPAPDGNYYLHDADEMKLRIKHGWGWALVGNLPADVNGHDYRVVIASKEGYVMVREGNNDDNTVYMLPFKGDDNHNIPCQALKMPSEFRGIIKSGCCFQV